MTNRGGAFLAVLAALLAACSGAEPMNARDELLVKEVSFFSAENYNYVEFNMGGVKIRVSGPGDYLPIAWARASAALVLAPAENIFAVFMPADESAPADAAAGSHALRGRRWVVISARPEFMNEYVEPRFFQSLCSDFTRVNGVWSHEGLERFQKLAPKRYKETGAFYHNLGVTHSTLHSLSLLRIVREDDSAGLGAISSYPKEEPPPDGHFRPEADALPNPTREYFAGAYHRVVAQNVLSLNGRCFNIYFSAPLEDEADIHALLEENRRYMTMISEAASAETAAYSASSQP